MERRIETDKTCKCSGCGRFFPPTQMTSMPRGEWLCDVCYGYGDESDYDEGRVKEAAKAAAGQGNRD